MRTSTEAIVIHCSATLAHQDVRRLEINAMHKRRGFGGIGYHWLIRLDGVIEQGRRPEDSVGAQVKGFNARTIGICYIGGLDSNTAAPIDTRNPAQLASMIKLLQRLCEIYPKAVILGHRDLSPDLDHDGLIEKHEWLKVCPCFDAAGWAKKNGLPGGKFLWGGATNVNGQIIGGKFVRI